MFISSAYSNESFELSKLKMDNNNRRSTSLQSPSVRAATSYARNQLIILLQELHEVNDANAQEVTAALAELVQLISDDEPTPPLSVPGPTGGPAASAAAPPPPSPSPPSPSHLQYSHEKVDRLLYSLDRTTDITGSLVSEDDKLCEICFQCFDEWRWGEESQTMMTMMMSGSSSNGGGYGYVGDGDGDVYYSETEKKPFQVQIDMMPENPVKLPCGHIFGELCLRTWWMIADSQGQRPPTCPKCRAKL